MKAAAIWNPRAGTGGQAEQAIQAVRAVLEPAGWQVDAMATERAGHATELARDAAALYGLVLAVGGDGTVSEALNGVVGTATVLGVIPVGTTNVWAREVGIPLDPAGAARLLLEGEVREIDVGWANGRHFLLMGGVGLDGEVMKLATPESKRFLGIMAYLLAGAWAGFTYRGSPAVITLDGRPLPRRYLHLMVVGNTRRYAFVEITAEACADDGMLDVCLFVGHEGLLTRLRHFLAVVFRRHTSAPDIEHHRARVINVRTAQPLAVQVDGDYVGTTPMTFRVLPQAVRVMLPRATTAGLFASQGAAIGGQWSGLRGQELGTGDQSSPEGQHAGQVSLSLPLAERRG